MSVIAFALPFEFEEPSWLWLALLVPVLWAASLRSLAGLGPVRRIASLLVRSAVVLLIVCSLAGMQRVRRSKDLTVIFLMDRSYSVQALQDAEETFIREAAKDSPPDDRTGMIDFSRHAYLQQLPMRGGYFIAPGRLPVISSTDRTNIASAIRLAMAMFPADTTKRIVLLSDGNENMGDLLTEARRAKANGVPVDVMPLRYERPNEVYFEQMIAPTFAEPGEQVSLRMALRTQKTVASTIAVYRNGKLLELKGDQGRVTLKPGRNAFSIKLPVQGRETQSYEAVVRTDRPSMDGISLNNSARAFTFVSGGSRVLIVSANPDDDEPLAEALRSEHVQVDLKSSTDLGRFTLPDMMSYSAIVLANVPAATFTDEQQQSLAIYVKDMGSGLIMTGGDEGFGAGGWIGSPVERVMPVDFEIKHKRVIPRGALVLIMHSCEIGRGNYWGKEMAKKSVDTISSQDYIGVLDYTFSPGGENWEVPLDLNTNKAAIKAKIDRMQNGDMPDFEAIMQMAYRALVSGRGRDAAQKHVIILSDGDPSPPSAALLTAYVKSKITVSTIGIGWGRHVMVPTMQHIAARTGGKFYPARNPRLLPQIFTKESKVVRRPLIIDEPFQPQVLHAHSELLAGLRSAGQIPPLGGMVLASPKQSPNVIIPLVRATDDGDDPVLAHWQYELGKAVAFTSGYWRRWGGQWTHWPKFAKFWAQIVRWSMRQDSPANFDTYTKIEGGRGRIVIDALDKDATYLNNLKMLTHIVGPDNTVVPAEFRQTGPGKYEAEFDADKAGQYIASVKMSDGMRSLGTIRTGLSVPFSPEYRDLIPNEALLRRVVDITDGRWLDDGASKADVFSHDLPPIRSKRPAWDWVVAWLVLPVFLLDVAVRRLASWLALSIAVELVVLVVFLFGVGLVGGTGWGILGAVLLAELIGWTVRFRYIGPLFDFLTHGVTALGHTGERSAASLQQLKTARNRVVEERRDASHTSEELGHSRPQEASGASAPASSRHYEVGEEDTDKQAGDLRQALGGAQPGEPGGPKPPPSGATNKDGLPEGEDATSRLLRAKRRARKDFEQDK